MADLKQLIDEMQYKVIMEKFQKEKEQYAKEQVLKELKSIASVGKSYNISTELFRRIKKLEKELQVKP